MVRFLGGRSGTLNIIPKVRRHIRRGGTIPRPRLAKNAVRGTHKHSGHMLFQPLLNRHDPTPVLLDTIIGNGWAVIGVDTDPQKGLHTSDAALCAALGAQYLSIKGAEAPALLKQIGSGQIALVRPDRYIAEIFPPDIKRQSLSWLAKSLKFRSEKKPTMDHYPQLARAKAPIVKAQDLAFVMFERPDLDLAERFLIDFGLVCIERTASRLVMRAAHDTGPAYVAIQGPKAKFLGLALRVKSRADLDTLSVANAGSPVQPLDLPAGGWHVRLKDPAGFEVWAVADQAPIGAIPVRAPLPMNTPLGRTRINGGIRPLAGPAKILRPGHCVLGVTEFLANARWYINMFGLIPSDIQTLEDDTPVLAFLRCDRGSELADHHSVVVSQNVTNSYSHSAYEVTDLDDLATGQEHLLSKKWKHAWGIGRHILGSQIFDYWRDPWKDKVEHFTDGDVFDADAPTGVSPLSAASLYQWGPNVPGDFEKPKLTPAFVWKVIGNIRRSPELTVKKVRMLLAAIEAPSRPWIK
jgi:hypothetical protein